MRVCIFPMLAKNTAPCMFTAAQVVNLCVLPTKNGTPSERRYAVSDSLGIAGQSFPLLALISAEQEGDDLSAGVACVGAEGGSGRAPTGEKNIDEA